MTYRNPWIVLTLSFFTLGVYAIYWLVITKMEMVDSGADIPTSWLLLVPLFNIYWFWKFSVGVAHVTRGQSDAAIIFLMGALLLIVGFPVIQYELNAKANSGLGGGNFPAMAA